MAKKPNRSEQAVKAAPKEERKADGVPGWLTNRTAVILLALLVVAVYAGSLSFGFTELDDSIFVKEFGAFNSDPGNFFKAFGRGLFDATKDPYYRPLFADVMLLNYQLSGEELTGYHLVNILLHLGSVLLFFRLCKALRISLVSSFVLAMLFAVHPVLSQAVAWIPGRNDTLLAVFVLSFFLQGLKYNRTGNVVNLGLSLLFLLLAYFTKETAVFAAPALWVLLVFFDGADVKGRNMVWQYGVWVLGFGIWYIAREAATTKASGIGSAQAFADMVARLPVLLQYVGKIVLPVNLSVFPTQEDTLLYPGILAALLLIALVVLSRPVAKQVWGGLMVFLLFLAPALLVPNELNQQTFEHRLYLPMMGILLMLPYTKLVEGRKAQQVLYGGALLSLVFVVINVRHQASFADARSFWSEAVATSPNSAYANMMLAARLDESEAKESEAMFRKAYSINPREKYLNFYMAEMLQRKDSVAASEKYLLEEKKISDYVRCDFYLARVYMERGDKQQAIASLERFVKRDKYNPMAHNNLLLLYVDTGELTKAKAEAAEMKRLGMPVPPQIAAQLGVQ